MNSHKLQYITRIILASIFVLFLPLAVRAQSLSLNILPAKIFISIEKGEKSETSITVTNSNDFPIDISIEIENFVPGILPGDIEFIVPMEGESNLADWIAIDKSFFLAAQSKKDVFFQIKIPGDVSSGGYYAVIFFTAIPKETGSTGPFHINSRVGSLVMLSVPGDISQEAIITKFSVPKIISSGPVNFEILIENFGNAHFRTEGNILIKNWLGRDIAAAAVEQKIVLPNGSQFLQAEWPVKFLFGFYRAELTIEIQTGDPLLASVSFFAFPWKQLLIFLVILTIIILISYSKGFRIIKRKR
ncbi:hypothetical protein IID20_01965 [Patescibacteria group bacterium]|nr:hypothetical protein [Patescibacteria group bacterium]